jgi:polyhydroxyalkanoate synthesis regulator phasin
MKEDRVLDAIISIVGKELKGIESKLAAPEINALEKLKPGIEKVLSSAGFVSESKYNSLKSRADKLEERLNRLEED